MAEYCKMTTNKEKRNAQKRARYKRPRARRLMKLAMKRWAISEKGRLSIKKYKAAWRKRNLEKARATCRGYEAKRRAKVLAHLGGKCVRCGFSDPRALQIDHVYGGGTKDLRKYRGVQYHNRVLKDAGGQYQLLCANCNWIKRVEQKEFSKGKNGCQK